MSVGADVTRIRWLSRTLGELDGLVVVGGAAEGSEGGVRIVEDHQLEGGIS